MTLFKANEFKSERTKVIKTIWAEEEIKKAYKPKGINMLHFFGLNQNGTYKDSLINYNSLNFILDEL